jgi:hypothetical protein
MRLFAFFFTDSKQWQSEQPCGVEHPENRWVEQRVEIRIAANNEPIPVAGSLRTVLVRIGCLDKNAP